MSITWGKDADADAMAKDDRDEWVPVMRFTWYDLIIWIVLGGLGWGAVLGLAWMIWLAVH